MMALIVAPVLFVMLFILLGVVKFSSVDLYNSQSYIMLY